MFILHTQSSITCLLVYVDDIILAGNDQRCIQETKCYLHDKLKIKDLGRLKYFLGLEVARSSNGIHVCQKQYVVDMLMAWGFADCKPMRTPMTENLQLSETTASTPLDDPTSYRQIIGKLLYLTNTRPDICYSVHKLSQFLVKPMITHNKAVHRILRYVKSNPGLGLFFSADTLLRLSAFSDADWGGCPDTRRSTTGYCVFLGNSLVSWKSKKQATVSRSSSEAEYRALASVSCEIQWISYLLRDLRVSHSFPASVYCDNKSAIYIAENPVFHERTKHIELDCHLVRERLANGLLKLFHVPAERQAADIFTKPLSSSLFFSFVSKLGLLSIHSPACGRVLKFSRKEEEQGKERREEEKGK